MSPPSIDEKRAKRQAYDRARNRSPEKVRPSEDRRRRPWTEQERKILRNRWGVKSLRAIAKYLRRSQAAIREQARAMGLRTGRETYTLSEVIRMTGYCHKRLRKAMRAVGFERRAIRLTLSYTLTKRRRQSPRCRYYAFDEQDIKRITDWIEAESKGIGRNEAMERLGVCSREFGSLLREAGITANRRFESKIWSLTEQQFDQVKEVHKRRLNSETYKLADVATMLKTTRYMVKWIARDEKMMIAKSGRACAFTAEQVTVIENRLAQQSQSFTRQEVSQMTGFSLKAITAMVRELGFKRTDVRRRCLTLSSEQVSTILHRLQGDVK